LYASFAYVQICPTCSTFLLKFKESEEMFNGANVGSISCSQSLYQSIALLKAVTLAASHKYILICEKSIVLADVSLACSLANCDLILFTKFVVVTSSGLDPKKLVSNLTKSLVLAVIQNVFIAEYAAE
jgi:hypothetical protein